MILQFTTLKRTKTLLKKHVSSLETLQFAGKIIFITALTPFELGLFGSIMFRSSLRFKVSSIRSRPKEENPIEVGAPVSLMRMSFTGGTSKGRIHCVQQ